jgi:glycine dehydrogenase subunit 1
LKELAELCVRKAHYAAEQLCQLPGVTLQYQRPFFKEFTLKVEQGAKSFCDKARAAGFDLGPTLGQFDRPKDTQAVIVAVTEKRTRQEIDALVSALRT